MKPSTQASPHHSMCPLAALLPLPEWQHQQRHRVTTLTSRSIPVSTPKIAFTPVTACRCSSMIFSGATSHFDRSARSPPRTAMGFEGSLCPHVTSACRRTVCRYSMQSGWWWCGCECDRRQNVRVCGEVCGWHIDIGECRCSGVCVVDYR